MKILLLAPQPFYEERGTPIAINLLARSLADQGHQIDLLCFAGKEEWQYENVTVHHVKSVPAISNIKPGFSVKKLYLDFFMFFSALRLLLASRYDVVHAVEESAFIALFFKPFFKYILISDCDSSMVTQLIDKLSLLRFIERPLRFLESLPNRFADAVVPMCDSLADDIRRYRQNDVFVLKDIDLSSLSTLSFHSSLSPNSSEANGGDQSFDENIRSLFGNPEAPLFVYIGNLESYQGIELLLESALLLKQNNIAANTVIIGGSDADIKHYQQWCETHQLQNQVKLIGRRSISGLAYYMSQADFLVSPRTQGSNTPMKVYSYLASSKPVIATRLLTHTQVMTDDVAFLVEPNANAFADAMADMANNKHGFAHLATNAAELIAREHSEQAFNKTVAELYSFISQENMQHSS